MGHHQLPHHRQADTAAGRRAVRAEADERLPDPVPVARRDAPAPILNLQPYGRIVWLRDIVTVVLQDGRPARLRGVMIDVTRLPDTAPAPGPSSFGIEVSPAANVGGGAGWVAGPAPLSVAPSCSPGT